MTLGQVVITRYRARNSNLRTQLERILHKADLAPWPRLFQNLRASRATELANEYPAHVAAAWLGHSTVVASEHYWQVTEDDFAKAIQGGPTPSAEAAQKAAQAAHAVTRSERQGLKAPNRETLTELHVANSRKPLPDKELGGTGFEPVTSTV